MGYQMLSEVGHYLDDDSVYYWVASFWNGNHCRQGI